ncbi:MAG TPA: hypothetical protein VJ851_10930 [Jatrophihabitans sp.]|nr:hypothetical protein [Jatrophihabitans sp.]
MTVHCGARRRGWAAGAAIVLSLALSACTSSHRTANGNPATTQPASSTGASGPSGKPTAGSSTRTGTASVSATASGSAKSQPTGGSEGASGAPGDKCVVTTKAAVSAAFTATVVNEQVSTSGIGSPLCTFSLARAGAGPYGAVTATAISGYPAAAFAQSKRSTAGAQPLALGISAFYVPATDTIKVLTGSSALTLQYSGYLAGSVQPTAAHIRAALIALAKAYLSQS